MKTGHTPSRATPQYWENTSVPWFTLADVWQLRDGQQVYLGETASQISDLGLANSAAELLPAGTVVLSRTASVGFSGVMPVPMATSQDFWNWVCGPNLVPEFLNYQLKSMAPELRAMNQGSTHQTIYQKDAASIQVLVPPVALQQRIVDYLDRETAKIDTLIHEQQRLIRLLKERKYALTASKTFGSTASRVPLRRIVDVIDCAHLTAEFVSDDTRFPVASIRECQGPTVDLSACNYTTSTYFELLRASGRTPRVGDLLFTRNVTVGLVSEVASGTPEFALGQETVLLRTKGHVLPSFLRYALSGPEVGHEINSAMVGSTFRRINVSAIRSLPVPLPASSVQREVVSELNDVTTKIDALVAEAERLIQLSEERRSTLITAAVTGQVKIPEAT